MKKTFQLKSDYRVMIDALPDEQAGQLIKAIFAHVAGEKTELEGALAGILVLIANQLDRDRNKYESVCEQNRQNISKRWNKNNPNKDEREKPIVNEEPKDEPQTDITQKLSLFRKDDNKKKNSNASWLMDVFDTFWKEYPKKSNKPDAVRAFIELNPDEALFEQMISEIATQKLSAEWKDGNGRHIPLPAKWLRDHRSPEEESDEFDTNTDF